MFPQFLMDIMMPNRDGLETLREIFASLIPPCP